MSTFDPAAAIGAAIALVAGVASAEWGLAPIRHALAVEAPSLDTTDADPAPAPLQADLASEAPISPPAVVVPVSTTPRRSADAASETAALPDPPRATEDDATPQADEDEPAAEPIEVPEIAAREPQPSSPAAPTDATPEEPPPMTPG